MTNTVSGVLRRPNLYVQCELEEIEMLVGKDRMELGELTGRKQVVWLPTEDSRVKEGAVLTLKDENPVRWWKISRTFTTIYKDKLNKDWKVGGLE